MIKKVSTTDGSFTYFNEQFNEHYHCLRGALSEAEIKHLGPAVPFLKNGAVVLDYCFGLGYNAFATLVYAEKNGITGLKVICLENDVEIITKIKELEFPSEYDSLKNSFNVISYDESGVFYVKFNSHELILILGDARETLSRVLDYSDGEKIDVVFFDPFSPKKCPELWEQNIFIELFSIMKNKSVLTTYSCATHVRNKLRAAGFRVADGPVYGRVSPATLGFKD